MGGRALVGSTDNDHDDNKHSSFDAIYFIFLGFCSSAAFIFFFFFSILCNLVGKVRVGSAVILRFICL